jgi:Family of unknown function (DUF6502)
MFGIIFPFIRIRKCFLGWNDQIWLRIAYRSAEVAAAKQPSDLMDLRQALTAAVLQLLRPLVRVLLRHGVAYDEFAELARRSYVDVAERDFGLHGRKQTTSRISVITGLNRKEVARLQALNAAGQPGEAAFAATLNRAARVVVGWQRDHAGADGAALELDAAQFAALVRKHSGDMPARAVLDELRHTGTVTVAENGAYRLQREGYVPQATDARKITLLGQHAADLLGTIDHNLNQPADAARLQQCSPTTFLRTGSTRCARRCAPRA